MSSVFERGDEKVMLDKPPRTDAQKTGNTEVVVGLFVIALGFVGLFCLGLFLNALALVCLWSWYLVPLGVGEIGYVQAMGIGLIFSLVRGTRTRKRDYDVCSEAGLVLTTPLVVLLFGWVIHFLM